MSTARVSSSPTWIWTVGIVYSVVILGIGFWASLATGEWIALLCAAGLVVVPVGGVALRSRTSPSRSR
ncbi:hypothetical protein GY21_16260 [Cryobacterium roopkundense]|uniref:Uncharacterized membrane protein (DUF2068 family) n=1 Tax=Cryobacterium roopkundense TaxID=1001240 RepID=A0A099J1J9_9MICO|nr:hypothetical protein [Cryobacterium roopkundense]KGJ72304.1 hypothetical protein GY21_16260 [Cryobacterium roopkundense]MBB5639898.1 uncharacterized membrane protein (DUF2068 family) [Cryobacterium roopkundense]